MRHHDGEVYGYANTPEGRAQIERDRIDRETRTDLRCTCILPGCHACIPVISNGFCSSQHTAAWHALPEDWRTAKGLSELYYRDDLDYTLSLVVRDGAAMNALATAGGDGMSADCGPPERPSVALSGQTNPDTGDGATGGSGAAQACVRCHAPTNRAARHAIYCATCAGEVHKQRLREQKRRGGSRAQYDRVLALWRSGVLAKVLERAG